MFLDARLNIFHIQIHPDNYSEYETSLLLCDFER